MLFNAIAAIMSPCNFSLPDMKAICAFIDLSTIFSKSANVAVMVTSLGRSSLVTVGGVVVPSR